MLAATFALTVMNMVSNYKSSRRNSIANDPTIAQINLQVAGLTKDIAYIKQITDQTAIRKEIAE